MPRASAILLALALAASAGCGPRYAVPEPGGAAIAAAQAEIAAAPALRPHARDEAEQKAMLRRVATRIAAAAQPVCQAQRGAACGFRFAYDRSSAVNAYASGRNDIAVTAGLLRAVDDDAELAAVIAHEIGHHIAEHVAAGQTRTTIGALAGAVLGAYAGIDLSGVGARIGRLSYSKADEREADYLAAYITARAGYDLDRAAGIWAKLAGSRGEATAGLLDTHPAGPERLAAWEAAVREIEASPDRLPRPAGGR